MSFKNLYDEWYDDTCVDVYEEIISASPHEAPRLGRPRSMDIVEEYVNVAEIAMDVMDRQ